MDKETFRRHDNTIPQAIELLKQADDILGFLIEVKIPELVIKISRGETTVQKEEAVCQVVDRDQSL